jgi:glycosyltransferase involved in cell wall biosynthesis
MLSLLGVAPVTIKLVIVTEIIAPYRIPVFNALALRPEVDLHVIFLSENDPSLRQWRVYKDEIRFSYQVLPSWRWRFGNRGFLVNRGLPPALELHKPGALLCGGYNHLAYWQAASWAKSRRTPFILWSESTVFDSRRGNRIVKFMKARFLRSCTAFLVPGKSSANYLKDLGVAKSLIFTAPNAIDNDLFSGLATAARERESQVRSDHQLPTRYFLYVGRLEREKGIFDLLDAYASLPPHIRGQVGLVFVGSGSQQEELAKRASKVQEGAVRLQNFVHREDLPAIYALAEALIFPTHSDPWGLVVNEAMACALPVVLTKVAGCAADLAENGQTALLVTPCNVPALADAMVNLAENSALRTALAREGRNRINQNSPAAWAQGVVEAMQFATSQ